MRLETQRHRRGASMTEYAIVVTVIAIALILGVTVYGQKILSLFAGASKSLDRGAPTKVDAYGSGLDINTDHTLANPRGTTNAEVTRLNATPLAALPTDANLTESDRRRILAALDRLPADVRNAGITGIDHTNDNNAYFDPSTNHIIVGNYVIRPDAPQERHDNRYAIYGIQLNHPLERVIYHEMLHAYHHNNSAVVDGFTGLNYAGKQAALNADPAYATATADQQQALADLEAAANAAGGSIYSGGSIDPAQFERFAAANPEIRDRWYEANDRRSAIAESHGLPSRYRGDVHSAGNDHEYFAIVLETARYDPGKFQRWRDLANDADPGNDVLTPAEIAWIDAHPNLWQ